MIIIADPEVREQCHRRDCPETSPTTTEVEAALAVVSPKEASHGPIEVADRLTIVPISFGEARAFVAATHRHRSMVVGHKFSVAVASSGVVVGVIIVGRPIARHLDDGWTLEALRVATASARNACSMLYGAAWRAARALGYRRLITYTLATESGVSLRAAGWRLVGKVSARSWHRVARPHVDRDPLQEKLKWEKTVELETLGCQRH